MKAVTKTVENWLKNLEKETGSNLSYLAGETEHRLALITEDGRVVITIRDERLMDVLEMFQAAYGMYTRQRRIRDEK